MAESLFLVYFRLVLLQSIYAAFIELIEYRYSRECAFGVQFGHVNYCTTSWSDDRNRHTRTIRILALNQSNAAESSCKDTTIMDNSCLYHRRCWFWFVIYSTVQFVTIRWTEIYLGFYWEVFMHRYACYWHCYMTQIPWVRWWVMVLCYAYMAATLPLFDRVTPLLGIFRRLWHCQYWFSEIRQHFVQLSLPVLEYSLWLTTKYPYNHILMRKWTEIHSSHQINVIPRVNLTNPFLFPEKCPVNIIISNQLLYQSHIRINIICTEQYNHPIGTHLDLLLQMYIILCIQLYTSK